MIQLDSPISKSPFFQQNLKHCVPSLNLSILMCIYLVLALISLIIGIVCIRIEGHIFYEEKSHENGNTTIWQVNVASVRHNLYLYQEVDKFMQNTRSYTTSFDLKQLKTNKQFGSFKLSSTCGDINRPSGENVPCGLQFSTAPEDQIQVTSDKGDININSKNIVFKAYMNSKKVYGPTFKQLENYQHKINWMQPSLGVTKKLYAIIPYQEFRNKTQLTIKIIGNYTPNQKNSSETYKRLYTLEEVTAFGTSQQVFNMMLISAFVLIISLALSLTILGMVFKAAKVARAYTRKNNMTASTIITYDTVPTLDANSVYVKASHSDQSS